MKRIKTLLQEYSESFSFGLRYTISSLVRPILQSVHSLYQIFYNLLFTFFLVQAQSIPTYFYVICS